MKKIFIIACLVSASLQAQVGIGTTNPNASAELDISSTTKGVLIPKLTKVQRDAIASPAIGLQIYNTNSLCVEQYNGTRWNCVGTQAAKEIEPWFGSDDNKAATSNAENMYVMGNVGIGINSPVGVLHIKTIDAGENTPNDAASLIIGNVAGQHTEFDNNEISAMVGNQNKGEFFLAAGTIWFSTWDTTDLISKKRMQIVENGNVGIGTSSPNSSLSIFNRVQLDRGLGLSANGADFWTSNDGVYAAEDDLYINSNADGDGNGNIYFGANTETSAAQNLMTIKNDGTIGIGTTSPVGILHIRNARDAGSNSAGDGAALVIGDAANIHLEMDNNEIVAMNGNKDSGSLYFKGTQMVFSTWNSVSSTSTRKVTLINNGSLGIGTASPTEKLQVNGKIRVTNLSGFSATDKVVTVDAYGVLHKSNSTAKTTNLIAKKVENQAQLIQSLMEENKMIKNELKLLKQLIKDKLIILEKLH